MERSNDNLRHCRDEIRRFGGTDFYPSDRQESLMELMNTLCDLAQSHDDATSIATARLHDTSAARDGEIRGAICPKPADFIAIVEARKREERAQVSWTPDRSMNDKNPWTTEERWQHDARWNQYLADPKNSRLVAGTKTKPTGLTRMGEMLAHVIPMDPNAKTIRSITEADVAKAREKRETS